jgi:hypothetical protein
MFLVIRILACHPTDLPSSFSSYYSLFLLLFKEYIRATSHNFPLWCRLQRMVMLKVYAKVLHALHQIPPIFNVNWRGGVVQGTSLLPALPLMTQLVPGHGMWQYRFEVWAGFESSRWGVSMLNFNCYMPIVGHVSISLAESWNRTSFASRVRFTLC